MTTTSREDPFMDRGLKLWIIKTAKRHHWRLAKWYDLDDLIQIGYMCWARTRVRYPELIKEPIVYGQRARFMSMFKLIYANEIHDMSNDKRRSIEEVSIEDMAASAGRTGRSIIESVYENMMGVQQEEATFAVKVAQAPLVVQNFLHGLETPEGMATLRSRLRCTSTHKEDLNEQLCRIAGCDPKEFDLVRELHDAFAA